MIAAQSIGEPGTQLTMRTFHIGGAAQLNEQSNLEAPVDGTIEFRDMPTIIDPRGRHMSLSRSGEIAILDMDGRELSTHRVPYGAHLLCESGHIVSRGDRIAEWDPSFSPVITEKAGTVKYQDLIENRTMTEVSRRIDRHHPARRHRRHRPSRRRRRLHPRLTLTGNGRQGSRRLSPRCRARSSRSRTASRSRPAKCSPACRAKRRGRATSPAACRASPSCSRRASPRRMRSSPRSRARSAS